MECPGERDVTLDRLGQREVAKPLPVLVHELMSLHKEDEGVQQWGLMLLVVLLRCDPQQRVADEVLFRSLPHKSFQNPPLKRAQGHVQNQWKNPGREN